MLSPMLFLYLQDRIHYQYHHFCIVNDFTATPPLPYVKEMTIFGHCLKKSILVICKISILIEDRCYYASKKFVDILRNKYIVVKNEKGKKRQKVVQKSLQMWTTQGI